jgi:hypothetical protein
MSSDAIQYLSDAIARIESGGVTSQTGSHLSGIYGKATNKFEKEMRLFVESMLKDCSLDYDKDIRPDINGPVFMKATLGNLIAVVNRAVKIRPKCLSDRLPGEPSRFLETLQRVNNAWVQVKHGDEMGGAHLLIQMKFMLRLLRSIQGGGSTANA